MEISVNGIQMAFSEQGQGPAVILLHGFPLDRRMWDAQVKCLAEAGFRAITPDLRGFGGTDAPPGSYSMDLMADDIVGLMDQLDISRASVGGMSMGGYILLNLLERYPQRLSSALFIVTQAADDNDAGRLRRSALSETALGGKAAEVTDIFKKVLFAERTTRDNPSLIRKVGAWMQEASPLGLSGGLLAIRDRASYLSELHRFSLPALVIGAEEDRAIPIDRSVELAEGLPNATLCRIPHAGHMANLEQPEAFNRCLLNFLTTRVYAGKTEGA